MSEKSMAAQVQALQKMTLAELRVEYGKVFGTPPPIHWRRDSLFKRLIEKLQLDHLPKFLPDEEAKVEEDWTQIRITSPDNWFAGKKGGKPHGP